ncbi:MAG: acyl transferase [Chitinophagales bacterium]|nr:acyl transferase [Chitinophagales bacterium]
MINIDRNSFDAVALSLFNYQYQHNLVYQQFVNLLNINIYSIKTIEQIPFLPITFFKSRQIIDTTQQVSTIFESSGTTQQNNSRHFVADTNWYQQISQQLFETQFGKLDDWIVLALLPSYLERENSSLVFMVDYFINQTKNNISGFYLYNYDDLNTALQTAKKANKKVLLLGVSFALLDFAEQFPQDLSFCTIMETGGMKGKRPEMTKEALHHILKNAFHVTRIYSEYGMTEMLSQAYSFEKGIFKTSATLKILLRNITDPFEVYSKGKGAFNVIDLANIHSCSFIAVDDIGAVFEDESFTIYGRLQDAPTRGCNLMLEDYR